MDKDLYYSYINDNGKRVNGAAALNHHIFTTKGGVQNYNDDIGIKYITKFVKEYSDTIHEELAKEAKKDRFKVVS